jgi:hypothetical protein
MLGTPLAVHLTDDSLQALWDAHPKTDQGVISWAPFQGPKGNQPKGNQRHSAVLARTLTRADLLAQREIERNENVANNHRNVFKRFDINADNFLSPSEYQTSLNTDYAQTHIDLLFSFEDEDKDGFISYVEFNGPKEQFTEPQMRAKFLFEDLLTPQLMSQQKMRTAVVTDFSGKMEAWADERFVDQRMEKLGKDGLVTPEAARQALAMLRNREFPVPRHWEMLEIVQAEGTTNTGGTDAEATTVVGIMLPMVRYLAVRYESSQVHEIRLILMELLDEGMSPMDVTPWVQASLPITLELLKAFHMDYELNAALIRQTTVVVPVYTDRANSIGVGTLHHITEEVSNVVTKHLFQIGDQMRLANQTFEEAYRAMANHPNHRGVEWRGDLYECEYLGLLAASPLFRAVVEKWNGPDGPSTSIHRSTGVGVGEDLFFSYTDLLAKYPGLNFAEEVGIRVPQHGWNIFHVIVLHGWTRATQFLHRHIRAQVAALGDDAAAVDTALDFVAGALLQQDLETGRTPLHGAALMYGADSDIFKALIALERCVRACAACTACVACGACVRAG